MNEEWKDVVGYEGLYQVSSLGNVRSSDREVTQLHPRSKQGTHRFARTYKGKRLRVRQDNIGRCTVSLSKDGKVRSRRVHQLVAEAFLGHTPDGTLSLVVDHIDNDPSNNRADNLQIVSQRANTLKDKRASEGSRSGVSRSSDANRRKPWIATAKVNGKSVYIGRFETEDEAGDAYDAFIGLKP